MTPVKAEALVRGGAAGQVLGTDETSRYLTLLQAASLASGRGFLQETKRALQSVGTAARAACAVNSPRSVDRNSQ